MRVSGVKSYGRLQVYLVCVVLRLQDFGVQPFRKAYVGKAYYVWGSRYFPPTAPDIKYSPYENLLCHFYDEVHPNGAIEVIPKHHSQAGDTS